MFIGRQAITALVVILVAAAAMSCGDTEKAGPQATVTKSETVTAAPSVTPTKTETATAEPSLTESPSPSFSTDEEFVAAVEDNVPYAADAWSSDEILQEAAYICDTYNNRGATWEEMVQDILDDTNMTRQEVETLMTLSLQYC